MHVKMRNMQLKFVVATGSRRRMKDTGAAVHVLNVHVSVDMGLHSCSPMQLQPASQCLQPHVQALGMWAAAHPHQLNEIIELAGRAMRGAPGWLGSVAGLTALILP